MNKKTIKFLSLIILLFVGFFIKLDNVRAEKYEFTDWGSPAPVISNENKFIQLTAQMWYTTNVKKFYLRVDDAKERVWFGFIGTGNPYRSTFEFFDAVAMYDEIKNSRYVRLYYNESDRMVKLETVNKGDYLNYYKNFNIDTPKGNWEYFNAIYHHSYDPCISIKSEADIASSEIMLYCGGVVQEGIRKYLLDTGGIIFVGEKNDTPYNTKGNLYTYYNAVLDYKKNKIDNATKDNPAKYSIQDIAKSWKALQGMIDAPNMDENNLTIDSSKDIDNRGYGPEFYQGTIKYLDNLLNDDIKTVIENLRINMDDNPSNNVADPYYNARYHNKPKISNSFETWFYYAGRYLFDDNLEEFQKYYKYQYAKELSDGNKDHLAFLEILENTDDIVKITESEKKISDDPCVVYCPMCLAQEVEQTDKTAANATKVEATNSNACTQCMQGGTKYRQCKEARDGECHNNCRYISGEAYDKCIDTCLSNKFEDYNETKEKVEKELDDLKNNRIEKNLKSLISLSAPELNIDFNEEGYKINCEDVSFLHNIYLVIIFLAPGLVILLGSIDFTKAVVASDEKKMSEFKKAFPKRIALLILLIVIPIVIKLLIGGFTDLESTLLDCVVNGS